MVERLIGPRAHARRHPTEHPEGFGCGGNGDYDGDVFGHETTPTRETGAIDLTIAGSHEGGWHILGVTGELDLASAPVLDERLAGLGGGPVALDVRDVTFIDSSGLSIVIAAVHRARDHGGRLVVVAADDGPVQRIMVLTGLDQIIDVVRSTDDLPR